MKRTIRIWSAYQWTCDDCGLDNWEQAIVQELTPDDRAEIAADHGVDLDNLGPGDLVSYPDEVKCIHCGSEFNVEHPE